MHPISSGDETYSLSSTEEVSQLSTSTSRRAFPQKKLCESDSIFCLKYNGPRDALTQKKAGFPCSAFNAGSSFISQDEGMSESPVETLEKAIVLNIFWTEGLTSI